MRMMTLLQKIDSGNIPQVEYLVNKYGIPTDAEWSDYILLRYTLWRGNDYIAKFLIANGCRLNKTTKSSTNTPLHIAVKHENQELVKVLLEKGALIESKNKDGETPLHFAVKTKNNKIIELILEKINSLDNECNVNRSGLTPIHLACMRNDPSIVEELLRCGSPKNEPVSSDSSFWPSYTPMHLAVVFERWQIVKILLNLGAYLGSKNLNGMTALHLAFQLNYMHIADAILEAHEHYYECINPTDSEGLSHFHIACTRKHPQIVKAFLTRGVEIDSRVNENSNTWPGYTPLHFAVENICVDNVKLLLNYGADFTLKNAGGLTALHLAIQVDNKKIIDMILDAHTTSCRQLENPVDGRGFSHFHAACMRNNTTVVKAFLEIGVDANETVSRSSSSWALYTALHFAVENRCASTVKLLFEYGADVNAIDTSGTTALHLTAAYTQMEIPRMLVARGANVNAKTLPYDMTPLLLATERGHLELVKLLLQHKADVHCMETSKCFRPLHIATMRKHFDIIDELLQAGANPDAGATDGKTALHVMTHKDSKGTIDMELVQVYSRMISSITDAGGDIDAVEENGRTPLHMTAINRSPSGAYALLQNGADINAEDSINKSAPRYLSPCLNYLFVEHIEKLYVLNFPVSEGNKFFHLQLRHGRQCKRKWGDIDAQDESNTFRQQCADELDRMRTVRVDCYSTLQSVLYKNQNELALHAMNESLKKMMDSREFERSYPIYGYLIRLQLKKGRARMVLLEPSKDSLQTLLGYRLPDSCSESIFHYLSNQELKNLISAKDVVVQSTS